MSSAHGNTQLAGADREGAPRARRPFVLALACLAAGCHGGEEGGKRGDGGANQNGVDVVLTPEQVKDARISVGPVGEEDTGGAIVTSGRVTFDDLRVSHVFSPVTGRVTRILAQPGQRVKKGTPLATIVSPDVGGAFSDLGKAHADLVAAEHDFKRKKDLYEAHAGSQSDLEAAEDNFRKSKAEYERAQQKARLFRAGEVDSVTQEYTLRALIDGEVVSRMVNPGVEVQGQYSGGTAVELFTIGELDQVWVLADVFETDVARVRRGARVSVRAVAYPEERFQGVVDWISDSLDPASRTAKVRCVIPNPDHRLKAEMYASVSISVAEKRQLAVPRTALRRMGEQTVIYVVKEKLADGGLRIERRPVAVNEDEGGDFLPVTHGLKAGENIVTSHAEEPADVTQSEAESVALDDKQLDEAKITVAPVAAAPVGRMIEASGKVTFDDLRVSHVFSPVTGRVTRIFAQPGQRVKKGDPLVAILSPDVGTAISDLSKANADLIAAQHDFSRKKSLFEAHAGSQSDYEAAEDNYKKAKAEIERAQAKAHLLHSGSVDTVTQEYTLRALIDGEVIARNVNPGVEVQGQYSGGTAVELFTIGELDQVWVLADVFEIDLAQVKKGARVLVKVVAYPNRTFEGRVDYVTDTLDPTTRTAKVRCALANPSHELKPEMYATVSVGVDERKALAVPREAILRLGDDNLVFVETGKDAKGRHVFRRRDVKIDEDAGGDFLPLLGGLKEGERIVTSGVILLTGML